MNIANFLGLIQNLDCYHNFSNKGFKSLVALALDWILCKLPFWKPSPGNIQSRKANLTVLQIINCKALFSDVVETVECFQFYKSHKIIKTIA